MDGQQNAYVRPCNNFSGTGFKSHKHKSSTLGLQLTRRKTGQGPTEIDKRVSSEIGRVDGTTMNLHSNDEKAKIHKAVG